MNLLLFIYSNRSDFSHITLDFTHTGCTFRSQEQSHGPTTLQAEDPNAFLMRELLCFPSWEQPRRDNHRIIGWTPLGFRDFHPGITCRLNLVSLLFPQAWLEHVTHIHNQCNIIKYGSNFLSLAF